MNQLYKKTDWFGRTPLESVFNVADLGTRLSCRPEFFETVFTIRFLMDITIISTWELLFSTILGLVEVCSPE